ncbi:MAG: potassium transporter TrkG [bacterium]
MNFPLISKLLGIIVLIIGGCLLFPAVWGWYYGESEVWSILIAAGICAAAGAGLFFGPGAAGKKGLTTRDGMAVVGLGWFIMSAFGCLPFVFAGVFPGPAGVVDAFFETMSGFTTTGATVLTDIEKLPRCLLFWRSMTHWLGGMGIVVLFVALMPFLGVGARQLYRSEAPGITHDGFLPKIRETARTLWFIYVGISALETILLLGAGMPLFEALCHTFGTMATGGFSTWNKSIAHHDNLGIDIIITIFMLSAGVNFGLYYMMIGGKMKHAVRDAELRVYLAIFAVSTLAVTANLWGAKVYEGVGEALRYASFQVASLLTTTGYCTANFDVWPPFSKALLVSLMFIGGCAGSTGGGMKVIRLIVLAKSASLQIYRAYHPGAALTVKIGGNPVPEETCNSVNGFFIISMGLIAAATLFVAMFGYDIVTSFTAVVATFWNIGPGLARVGSIETYAFFPPAVKAVLAVCMALGRLELFTVLVLFSPSFWKR